MVATTRAADPAAGVRAGTPRVEENASLERGRDCSNSSKRRRGGGYRGFSRAVASRSSTILETEAALGPRGNPTRIAARAQEWGSDPTHGAADEGNN